MGDADTTAADGAPDPPPDAAETVIEMTERLVLDELTERLDTLKLLRADGDDAANDVLDPFGARGQLLLVATWIVVPVMVTIALNRF